MTSARTPVVMAALNNPEFFCFIDPWRHAPLDVMNDRQDWMILSEMLLEQIKFERSFPDIRSQRRDGR